MTPNDTNLSKDVLKMQTTVNKLQLMVNHLQRSMITFTVEKNRMKEEIRILKTTNHDLYRKIRE